MQISISEFNHARKQQRKYQCYATLQCLLGAGAICGGLALLFYASACTSQNDDPRYWQLEQTSSNSTSSLATLSSSQTPPNDFFTRFSSRILAYDIHLTPLAKQQNGLHESIATLNQGQCDSTIFYLDTNDSALFKTVQSLLIQSGAHMLNQNTIGIATALLGIGLLVASCLLCQANKRNQENANSWKQQVGLYEQQLNVPMLLDCEDPVADTHGVQMQPLTPQH